jgi:hypothetical protein
VKPEKHFRVYRTLRVHKAKRMKLIAEYLERAHQFERMAASESDPKLKADLERQAQAYQNLAKKRAIANGLPLPKDDNAN